MGSMDKLLIAFGGNAIIRAGQMGTYEEQLENIRSCCSQLAELYEQGCSMVITHGNGPQVGNILIQNESAAEQIPVQPLHSCVAQTQGQLGYMLQCELENEFRQRGKAVQTAAIVTRVLVDSSDEAFSRCTKPIGPFFSEQYAKEKMEQGETWINDSGRGWRRVVPSPQPIKILELEIIKHALEHCGLVIAVGGGGVPVVEKNNQLVGIDAVIDKDLASALLARDLGLDALVLLTDVSNVKLNFGQLNEQDVDHLTAAETERYLSEGQFGTGSMAPKIQAALDFVKAGGKRAIITSLTEVNEAVKGRAGTVITR
ncbi:MAG: carbamate kinase [Firmicutes bacterium]|nr:carbamate kinase [Bacillota bacterium]